MLIVFTVATNDTLAYQIWLRTAAKYGYTTKTLAMDEEFGGWSWRTQKYLDALRLESDDNLYALVDSSDLYFVRPYFESEFKEAFDQTSSSILVSCEQCSPEATMAYKFQKIARSKNRTRYIYPNAGSIVGTRRDLIKFLEINLSSPDDQTGIREKFLSGELQYSLDYDFKVSATVELNLDEINRWEFRSGLPYNKEVKNYPFWIHFPGGNVNKYNYFLQQLHQELELLSPDFHAAWLKKKANKKFESILKNVYIILVLIILLILIVVILLVSRNK